VIRACLATALAIAAAFGAAHLAGLREHTALLSGTSAASPALGVGYALLYFAFVVVAPILALAAGIAWAAARLAAGRR
jgi:hypothetical protein